MGVLYAGGDIGKEIEGEYMNLIYKKATVEDIDLLTKSRMEVLKAANKLPDDTDMAEVEAQSYDYYKKARFGFVKLNDEMELPEYTGV